jgi:hypothetical protein
MQRLKRGEISEFALTAFNNSLRPLMVEIQRDFYVEKGDVLPEHVSFVWAMSMYIEAFEKDKMVRVDNLTGEIIIE